MAVPNRYTLPQLSFIGGTTREYIFHCYHYINKRAQDLSSCDANFAVVNYVNKNGEPLISKPMTIGNDPNRDGEVHNVLRVSLDPHDTVGLPDGKYIYQITLKDVSGNVEIPDQGIIYIANNINKEFVG